jgi:hypothetical protein
MSKFDQLRRQLREIREEREASSLDVTAAQERLKQIAVRESQLDRVTSPKASERDARYRQLVDDRKRAHAALKSHRDAQEKARARETDLLKEFAQLSDPRKGIEYLNDSMPILLMPIRLETRFKGRQLWVRVYPDDCWVDSFDPTLTETEVANAKAYWTSMWQAGGIEDLERGAWRGLASSHGSGRAAWIIQQCKPTNLEAKPLKARAQDIILTVATEIPLDDVEATATASFWRETWLADGDAAMSEEARARFEARIGDAGRAAQIMGQYQPGNFAAPLADGLKKQDVNVSFAYVIFAPVEAKQHAWAHPAKMTLLPDRFVFVGYDDSESPTIELGNPVRCPLVAGPSPSVPQENSWTLSESEVKNLSSFASTLKTAGDSVSSYIRDQLTPPTKAKLMAWSPHATPPRDLCSLIIKDINSLIDGDSIWAEERFKNVTLRRGTRLLLASARATGKLARLNRRLLEDAYPMLLSHRDQQVEHDSQGNLFVPNDLKWICDFDRAVDTGMAFRINLTDTQTQEGFKRVLVVGLRLSADEETTKRELEALFRHHAFSRKGLAIVPQGTPTNNTEATGSGFSRIDNPDESFDDLRQPLFAPTSDWRDKKDGQWVAEYVGIDSGLFRHLHQAGASDQAAARATNIALWPATLGYWMEAMMTPIFGPEVIERTRDFFNQYVVGAGVIPAIRIGMQPYGILPTAAVSRIGKGWLKPHSQGPPGWLQDAGAPDDPMITYLRQLYPLLIQIGNDWRAALDADPHGGVSFVVKSGDPHALLLDLIGLHSGSVEWSQRYAEGLRTLYNRCNLVGFGNHIDEVLQAARQTIDARRLIRKLGYGGDNVPLILQMLFSETHKVLKGGVVDDRPPSEREQIREYTPGGRNYIEWLIDAARTSLEALYKQQGFTDDKRPTALLYLLLRHALQLGYHDVSIRLHEHVGLYTAEQGLRARVDSPFIHIQENPHVSESRYQPLFKLAPEITGNNVQTVGGFIASRISSLDLAFYLREQLAALERLKSEPTARLERAFADHMDCCSYRLDAWLLGIVNYQLALMRNIRNRTDAPARQGVYLGAYAWLEELKPQSKPLTEVRLADRSLMQVFSDAKESPLMRDRANQGYIHAPSLNHAVAAAVLRNGFLSDATPENRQTMAVNLTSERVRTALALLEGIRGGQSLSDLLGYQFERGLHDRHDLAEVDKFIYKLRRAFPLRANRLNSGKASDQELTDFEAPPDRNAIEAIEARNVIDGLALVEHINATGNKTYPFGKLRLPSATVAEQDAINAEADRLLEAHDAVADMALSEGVYQAVMGNYDRVASTYDAYARGNFPPEPDVIRTPQNGIGLTHRVALHLEAGADPNISPIADIPMTPRAQGEPALNRWLASLLPPLDQVGCLVAFRDAAGGGMATREVTLRDLDLQAADLIALIRDDKEQAMTELDDRIVRFAVTNFGPRPDVPIRIRYMETDAAVFSIFALMPLVRNLRRLITKSRPLRATDLKLMNEAESAQDSQTFVSKARLETVRAAMQALRNDLDAFRTQLQVPLSDLQNRRDEILTDVDDYLDDLTALLGRAATFVVAQAGWGFAYDFRRLTYTAILQQCAALVSRWEDRRAEFDALLTEEQALPATATDQEHFDVLMRAERAISTTATIPLPATPAAFRSDLQSVKRVEFDNKLSDFDDIQDTTETSVSRLLADVRALLPITAFDFAEFTLIQHEDEMMRFTEDAVGVVKVVIAELDRRLASSRELFDDHAAAAAAAAKVRALENAALALLGEDFRIFPEFSLGAVQGDELENALAASRSGELFEFLTNPPDPTTPALDFPVDAWLYGVARVRENMRAWEQLVMLVEGFGLGELELHSIQLPFVPGDSWLALEFPPGQQLDRERLLYTAHFAKDFDKSAVQCGLLLDEWTEIIPASDVDTGIAFHHDRPNCEAPQTMLLVTPSDFRGTWRWDDLVDALNETLDLAKLRGIEPRHIDETPYAPFLPATIMATQAQQLTISVNLAMNNDLSAYLKKG